MPLDGLSLVFDLGLILVAATVFNFLAKLLKQPPLLAYIAAGMFIGPLGLGSLGIRVAGVSLGVSATDDILLFSSLGVAFLLFSVGIETNLKKIAGLGKLAFAGTILQVGLTIASVLLFNRMLGVISFAQAFYLGIILAFSSTSVVVKILSDSHELNALHGRVMIGFLLVQDLIAVLALPMLQNFPQGLAVPALSPLLLGVVAILALAFMLNRYAYQALFDFASRSEELLFLSAMSSVFVFIFLAYSMGLPVSVGAFIAGVSLSTLPYNLEVLHKVRGVRDFLATIFFVTLGIQIAPSFAAVPLLLGAAVLLVVFVLKPLVIYAITSLSGYGGKVSLAVALALAQVSEFSFIIAGQGRAVLDSTTGLYSFTLLVIGVSMALTPYFMIYTNNVYEFINRHFKGLVSPLKGSRALHRRLDELQSLPQQLSGHIIVFGGGTVGSNIAASLKGSFGVVVVDSDSEVVSSAIHNGMNAMYGTADNREVWKKVNVEGARAVVVTVPYPSHVLSLLSYIRSVNPRAAVFARAHYFRDALALYESGADYVVMPHVIGSNTFVTKLWNYLETGSLENISDFREEYLSYLREKAAEEERIGRM